MKRPLGYDVDDNATRFSNYFHVLRELVHLTNGWLPLEPSCERKYALGDHVHDDARALTKIKRRLYELRTRASTRARPRRSSRRLLDRMARRRERAGVPDRRLQRGEARARAARCGSTSTTSTRSRTSPRCGCSPRSSERQERHTGRRTAASTRTSARCRCACATQPRELRILPPLDEPARDDFVEVTEHGDPYLSRDLYVNGAENHVPIEPEEQRHFFHGLMDAELCAAELMARNSHEHPEMPWDFHVDMARQNWDEVRHARLHDLLMKERARLRVGRLPGGLLVLQVDLRVRPARSPVPLQRHERAAGDVAPLAPAQDADGAGPGARGARVRLPARRRGAARAQRRALGLATCSAGASRRTARRCASCATSLDETGAPALGELDLVRILVGRAGLVLVVVDVVVVAVDHRLG